MLPVAARFPSAAGHILDSIECMFDEWPDQFTPSLRRVVDPPRPILIDLPQAIPTSSPAGFGRNRVAMGTRAGGLDLTATVPGLLRGWARATDGTWLGLCEFIVLTGNQQGRLPVAQLCPASAIRQRGR